MGSGRWGGPFNDGSNPHRYHRHVSGEPKERSRSGTNSAPTVTKHGEPLSWPLVERRRSTVAFESTERRAAGDPSSAGLAGRVVETTPLTPFRIAALVGAIARGHQMFHWSDGSLVVCTAIVAAYTAFVVWQPVSHTRSMASRLRTVGEAAIMAGVVMATGGWLSPFTLCLIPTVMLATFVGGALFSGEVVAGVSLVVTLQYLADVGVRRGGADAAVWIALLALVTATSGFSYRAAQRTAAERQVALQRVGRLAEANALLFSLQRVAQTLPASLDLEEVLDSTVSRVRSLIDAPTLTVLLMGDGHDSFDVARAVGHTPPVTIAATELPVPLREALSAPKTIRVDATPAPGHCLAAGTGSGIYAAMRARGAVVGLIAVESSQRGRFDEQHAEVLHGLAEPFGIAIDNARLFRRLRLASADEERNRIARDLHDHIGSSLAYLGFELDRSIAASERGELVGPTLRDLREQVTTMVGEVRETLYDLRSDVSPDRDLAGTLAEFVQHLRGRSGLDVSLQCEQHVRVNINAERELWNIARESLINVERHAQATHVEVEWRSSPTVATLTVRDDGIGMLFGAGRADSYGLRGMRERAAHIGAQLTTESAPVGTVIRVVLEQPRGTHPWD